MDAAYNTLAWIIIGSFMVVGGIVGIFKGELSFRVGRGRVDIPVNLKAKFGLASSISLIVGGALLIIGTRPLESGLDHVLSALGCVIPLVIVGFCYIMQTLINMAMKNYERNHKVERNNLTK